MADEVELKIFASDTTEGTMDDVSTCSRLYRSDSIDVTWITL